MPAFYAGQTDYIDKLEALWNRVTEQLSGTSVTSLLVGAGATSLVTQADKQFAVGQSVRITRTSDVSVWMQGIVTDYNATTGALDVLVDDTSGAGTFDDWTISLTGGSGPAGEAATVGVGVVTTGAAGSDVIVTNAGTPAAAVLDFTIPRGNTGLTGPANTLVIGAVTGGPVAGATISGAAPNQTLDLVLPQGDQGDPGLDGDAATVAVGTVTTGAPGSSVIVTNVGTPAAAVLDFTIPRGDAGAGSGDFTGPVASVDGEVVLFSGVSGKLGKRATGSGLAVLTDGVLSVVAATTASIAEHASNLYFTTARVLSTALTGLSTAAGTTVTAAHTVLEAIGFLQKQTTDNLAAFTAHAGSGAGAHADAVAAGNAGFMTGADKTKLDGIAAGATANSSDATLLARANHTGTQLAATVSDFASTVRSTVLTGLSTAAGTTVTAAHTILEAIGFLQKQNTDQDTTIALKAPLASPALTGTPTAPTAAAATNTTQLATTAHVFAERSNTATLTGKTLLNFGETVYAVTDAAGVALSPTNGSIQTWTLTASRTPTVGTWAAGQGMTLMIADGTAYAVTWTTMAVTWVGGTAPTLPTAGYGVVELWKVGTTIYGASVGNVA